MTKQEETDEELLRQALESLIITTSAIENIMRGDAVRTGEEAIAALRERLGEKE